MARPKRVKLSDLHLYTKLHTRKVKMYCGVEITALHLLKKTAQYYISIESWSFCVSTFKEKIKKFVPKFALPKITDSKTAKFLDDHAWHDKEVGEDEEVRFQLLNKLYPKKKQVFFYELDAILSCYCHGSLSVDKNGKRQEHAQRRVDYLNYKYLGDMNIGKGEDVVFPNNVNKLKRKYRAASKENNTKAGEKASTKAYKEYMEAAHIFLRENHDLTPIFNTIGQNIIVCPYIFPEKAVDSHDGEIIFMETSDAVYYSIERHY